MPAESMLEAALDYVRRGWPTLPLDGKVPVDPATGRPMRDWPDRATTDLATLRRWLATGAPWNVGVMPRRMFVSFDVDRRRGDDDRLHELEIELGELPRTPTYSTSDGWRLLFAPPDAGGDPGNAPLLALRPPRRGVKTAKPRRPAVAVRGGEERFMDEAGRPPGRREVTGGLVACVDTRLAKSRLKARFRRGVATTFEPAAVQ